jgi:hypothetical protein
LNRARAYLSGLRSILMEEKTLLSHRAFWVKEDAQHSALELPNLNERALKEQRWGLNLRFEQERIAWSIVTDAIAY